MRDKLNDIVAKKPLQTAILTTSEYDRGYNHAVNDALKECDRLSFMFSNSDDLKGFKQHLEALRKL